MKTSILTLALCLSVTICSASKQDDLAAENANLRAQLAAAARQRDALAQAVAKGNSNAAQRSATAVTTTDANAAAAQQAVAEQKESADRIERKAEAAKASADDAAKLGQSNNSMLYISVVVNLFAFLGIMLQAVMKYASDGRNHAWQRESDIAAREHAGQLSAKMDTIKTQTDGMTTRIEALAAAGGHSQGMLDERNNPGKTGD